MPVYEYICKECDFEFEMLRPRSKADEAPACKHCQGTHTARKLSLFAAHSNGRALAGSNGDNCAGCSSLGSGCSGCSSH